MLYLLMTKPKIVMGVLWRGIGYIFCLKWLVSTLQTWDGNWWPNGMCGGFLIKQCRLKP